MSATQEEKKAHRLMRRGTRACCECRRRKIKCIYDEGRDDICQECTTHTRTCIPQGKIRGGSSGQASRSVKVQVARLEFAVQKLAREKANIHESVTAEAQNTPAASNDNNDSKLLEQQLKKRSPIFALFDNDTIKQNGIHEAYSNELTSTLLFTDPNMSDREKLLSTIANTPNILDVIEFGSDWWISWREQHFALRKTVGLNSLRNFVEEKLNDQNCIAVAMGLLAIAVALGHLRVGIDDHGFNLPVPAAQMTNHILAAVDQIVCDSRKYHDDMGIILLFMMRAKQHTENNQLRKAWVRIRQAIHCAQAMGFGTAIPVNGFIPTEQAEQQRFIASVFEIDYFISMVLGAPHEPEVAFTDARAFGVLLDPTIDDESLKMRALRRITAVMAGHINDRNASGEINDELTEGSQQTLELAASQMPDGWWNLLEQPLLGTAQHRYESIMVQCWYYTTQCYLNMPYLINPTNTPAGNRFRKLCLDGTRNLLRTYVYLRSEPSVSVYMCNCDDFQGLLAGVNLIVGILQDAALTTEELTPSESDMSSPEHGYFMETDADLALIEELKDIFRYRMHEQGGGISKNALQVMEELTSFLYLDDEPASTLDQSEQMLPGIGIELDKQQKTIMLPYFGTISIQLTKKIPKRKPQTFAHNRLPTPPHSSDGYISELSTYSHANLLNANEVNINGVPQNNPWPVDPRSSLDSYYSPTSEPSLVCTNEVDHSQWAQNTAPISWDSWETFMVDQELSQCWNPELPCPVEMNYPMY